EHVADKAPGDALAAADIAATIDAAREDELLLDRCVIDAARAEVAVPPRQIVACIAPADLQSHGAVPPAEARIEAGAKAPVAGIVVVGPRPPAVARKQDGRVAPQVAIAAAFITHAVVAQRHIAERASRVERSEACLGLAADDPWLIVFHHQLVGRW